MTIGAQRCRYCSFNLTQSYYSNSSTTTAIGYITSPLHACTSTSGCSALTVVGTNGTLFEVVNDLSDSLMSVNDAAGLPVLEVNADNSVCAGRYGQSDFYISCAGQIGIGTSSPGNKLQVKET